MTPQEIWPLSGLRLRTPRLVLSAPDPAQLLALAAEAGAGPSDPGLGFLAVRTDTPVERARRTVQMYWAALGAWSPDAWDCVLAVHRDGRPVGLVNVKGRSFPVTREVSTGSWLVPRERGDGVGTEMRSAALHLAFAGLGARAATSQSRTDNAVSLRVSAKLGYRPDGTEVRADGAVPEEWQRLRLPADRWAAVADGFPVQIEGLAACRPLFGLPA
jgi:RimJ/RimL family protein N-acetyltransferase